MAEVLAASARHKQHVIDPEICIRCNTCEDTCPVDAVTHDDNNYVVDPEKCNFCLDCISPCPTGAIVFGDLNVEGSDVQQLQRTKRSYDLLEELNTKPRLKYLARVSNPGVQAAAPEGHGDAHGSEAGHGGHASAARQNGAQS